MTPKSSQLALLVRWFCDVTEGLSTTMSSLLLGLIGAAVAITSTRRRSAAAMIFMLDLVSLTTTASIILGAGVDTASRVA